MHSIVPLGNRFWLYPDLPGYGEDLSKDKRIRLAHKILREGGYDWKIFFTPPS
jgi:hypothetical protein